MDDLNRFIICLILSLLTGFTVFLGVTVFDLSEQVKILKDDVHRLEHPVLEGME